MVAHFTGPDQHLVQFSFILPYYLLYNFFYYKLVSPKTVCLLQNSIFKEIWSQWYLISQAQINIQFSFLLFYFIICLIILFCPSTFFSCLRLPFLLQKYIFKEIWSQWLPTSHTPVHLQCLGLVSWLPKQMPVHQIGNVRNSEHEKENKNVQRLTGQTNRIIQAC